MKREEKDKNPPSLPFLPSFFPSFQGILEIVDNLNLIFVKNQRKNTKFNSQPLFLKIIKKRVLKKLQRMEMMYYPLGRSSYEDSLKVIEADIQHANALAAAIPKSKDGARFQMKLVHDQLTPLIMFLLQWIDSSCTCLLPRYLNLFHVLVYKVYTDGRPKISRHGRKATVSDFYAVILPSLRRLHYDLVELDSGSSELMITGQKKLEKDDGFTNLDLEREDECGICLEPCTKIVLPNCCHAMCINCYRDWNSRSASCPFCRGNIKRVKSRDLWVLTCNDEVIDADLVSKEDLVRFYLYINNLPKDSPDALFFMFYEYLI